MNISNHVCIASLFIITLLIAAVSCDSSSGPDLVDAEEVEVDFFFNLQQPFDLLLGKDAVLEGRITVIDEPQDNEVDGVYIYLYSLSVSSQDLDLDLSESPVKLYQISGEPFAATEDGASGIITVPLADVVDNLPAEIVTNQLTPGDIMGLQWRVRLNNGLKVSEYCSGDSADNKNYCTDVEMVHSLPEGAFTGLYTFTQLDSSSVYLTGTVDEPQLFSGMQFESELVPVQNWYGDQRMFRAEYLKFLGYNVGPFDYVLKFDVASGSVTLRDFRGTGLGCSTSMTLGAEKEPLSSFDMNDDSEFVMALTDNTEGDCSSPPVQVRFHVQKTE